MQSSKDRLGGRRHGAHAQACSKSTKQRSWRCAACSTWAGVPGRTMTVGLPNGPHLPGSATRPSLLHKAPPNMESILSCPLALKHAARHKTFGNKCAAYLNTTAGGPSFKCTVSSARRYRQQ